MAVGEAPGYREDEESKPFVGRAGKYLDEVLEEVKLPRSKVFISNVVKCRPPDNRTPKTREIKACLPYLQQEIESVNPEYIIALGSPALKALTGKSGIMKLHGTWLDSKSEFGNRKVFACIHPSGILRREFMKPKFSFALRQFSNITQGKTSKVKTDYQLVRTKTQFREAKRDIRSAKEVAWDIENSGGFNPWHGGNLLVVGFCTRPGKVWVFPLDHPDMRVSLKTKTRFMKFFKEILESDSPKKIGANLQYERKWMSHFGIAARNDFDVKVAAYLLDENGPTGLKPLAKALCQAPNWDEGISWEHGPPRLKDLWQYNAGDCDYTFRVKEIQAPKLMALPELARLFKFLMLPSTQMLGDIEHRGICIDRERLNDRYLQADRKLWEIKRELDKLVPKGFISEDRKGNKIVTDDDFGKMKINWGSTKFLGWFLFKYLDLPIIELTKTGKMGTREAVLLRLRGKHKAVDLIIELREWQGRMSKFLGPWIERAIEHKDGSLRLHTTYNLTKTDQGKGTETGRLSSDNPNMQQVPREKFIRGIVTAKPGWKFGQVDLAQAELRIASWIAQEKNMLRAFLDGRDIHLETACEITRLKPPEVDKETRKKAKAVNFGFLYGMYPKKFQVYALEKYQTRVTIEEAREARNSYFNKYPQLLVWHDRVRRFVASAGYVKSPLGRRRRLPHIHSMDDKLRMQAERQAINAPVQATASDFILMGMYLVEKEINSKIFEWVGQVHDAGLFQYDPAYEDLICHTIKNIIENLPTKRYFGVKIGVPIIAEIEIGTHWSEGITWEPKAA